MFGLVPFHLNGSLPEMAVYILTNTHPVSLGGATAAPLGATAAPLGATAAPLGATAAPPQSASS